MQLIADILLTAGAFSAAIYCWVLSVRLKRFTTLENGMGSAIAVLSAQVDDMTTALTRAQGAATGSAEGLQKLVHRAEAAAAKLELMVASLHDLQDPADEAESVRKLRVERRRLRNHESLEATE